MKTTKSTTQKSDLVFGLDSLNGFTAFASFGDAEQGGFTNAFSTPEELSDILGDGQGRLIAVWNAQPGVTPVKRFMSRTAGLTRLWAHLIGSDAAVNPVVFAKPAKAAKPAKVAKSGRRPDLEPELVEPELGASKGITINGNPTVIKPGKAAKSAKSAKAGKKLTIDLLGTGAITVKPAKSARAAKPGKAADGSTTSRVLVFGFPVTQALAWMGREGFKFTEAVATLTALGVEPGMDSTVRTYLTKGKAGTKKAAAFTTEQAAEVRAARPVSAAVAA